MSTNNSSSFFKTIKIEEQEEEDLLLKNKKKISILDDFDDDDDDDDVDNFRMKKKDKKNKSSQRRVLTPLPIVESPTETYNNSNKSYNTGYYMYPRSSLSKTMLRLANSVGIIDAGYRGHLIGMFDVINNEGNSQYSEVCYNGNIYDRYLQICAPGLLPIIVEIVKNKEDLGEETERGEGGFGSTGK
jgi:hypothetical protein